MIGHSACSTLAFGYCIGPYDELPSVVGISGADAGEGLRSVCGSPPVELAGHAPHCCRDDSALLVPGEHYRVGVPISRFVTVWEDCSGQLGVCRPTPLLDILILIIWTGWGRNYRPHARLRGRFRIMQQYNENICHRGQGAQ